MLLSVCSSKSLIKSKKRVGEMTEPCGTPALIEEGVEMAPSTQADMNRLDKKLDNHEINKGWMPKEGNLARRHLCQTLSKALLMSKATTLTSPKLLRARDQWCVT
jgi:hypothetical protein